MTKGRPDWANFRRLFLPLLLGAFLLALPATASAAEPEPGNITGVVTEGASKPVVEVEVCAETIDKMHFKCIPTRSDGTFEITGLAPGEYKVGFWSTRNFVTQFWHEALTWGEAAPVVVAAGETTPNIDADLEVGSRITGTVTAAATGLPVGEVEACATSGELERCAITNGAGVYTIDGLREGTWSVYFYAMKAKVDVVSQPYAAGAVTIGPQQTLENVNEALIPGGQIAGMVRLAGSGAPVGGVLVCVTTATESAPLGCLRTPNSGAYRFTRVWPGTFKVVFSPEPTELFGTGPEGLVEAATMEATEGIGPDAFPTEWWSGAGSFDAATPITIAPPQIIGGIDASLTAPPTPPAAAAPPPSPAPVVKKPLLKCKRGFVKRKVHGKQRCVKRHKSKPKPRHKRHKQAEQPPRSQATRP